MVFWLLNSEVVLSPSNELFSLEFKSLFLASFFSHVNDFMQSYPVLGYCIPFCFTLLLVDHAIDVKSMDQGYFWSLTRQSGFFIVLISIVKTIFLQSVQLRKLLIFSICYVFSHCTVP